MTMKTDIRIGDLFSFRVRVGWIGDYKLSVEVLGDNDQSLGHMFISANQILEASRRNERGAFKLSPPLRNIMDSFTAGDIAAQTARDDELVVNIPHTVDDKWGELESFYSNESAV